MRRYLTDPLRNEHSCTVSDYLMDDPDPNDDDMFVDDFVHGYDQPEDFVLADHNL